MTDEGDVEPSRLWNVHAIWSIKGLFGVAEKKEIDALAGLIATKLQRVGGLSVNVSEDKGELDETQAALSEDEQFCLSISGESSQKANDWETMEATRKEELLAVAETTKVLNDDGALELFNKILPGSASFVQIQVFPHEIRSRALDVLRRV